MKNLNSEIRTKVENQGGEVYANTENPAYAYRVTKSDGSVEFQPLKPFVYYRQPVPDTGSGADRPLQPDTINPSHYKQGDVECIDAIKSATGDGFTGYLTGNILKYIWRWKHKNGIEDLKKARWYLDRLIGELEGD